MRVLAILCLALVCAGCDLSMTHQPKSNPGGSSVLWPGGPPIQAPPDGTAPVDAANYELRPPMTKALLERGRDRYEIYCTPCHGERGRGDGAVVARGFPAPPSDDLPRLRAAPIDHFYRVVTDGYGVMFSYADRLSAKDRWAVAAYVRALQTANAAHPQPRGAS